MKGYIIMEYQETDIEILQDEIKDLNKDIEELKEELEKLEDKNQDLDEQVDRLREELEKAENEEEYYREKYEEYQIINIDELKNYIIELYKDLFMYVRPSERDLKTVAQDLERIIK
jgi:regulator of replication initiation timing